jgi:anti-sigma factor ChrR (cupin superfamily)
MSANQNQAPWFVDEETDQYLASLDLAMPAGEPPAALWARIAGSLAADTDPDEGRIDVRLDQGRWREFAPGVTYKRLWNRNTLLLQCAPGAWVPEHEHTSFEHTVVVSGDLVIDDQVYGPGDYQGTPAGGTHPLWTTRTGCVVLVHYEVA